MSSPAGLEHRLDVTYRYFSHHIRTCTSVVVAMLDAVAEGLTDDSMTAMIMESGYLLDIYDRGMSVCFNHILNKPHDMTIEPVDVAHLIEIYEKNAVSDEMPASVVSDITDLKVKCDSYSFKSLFQIFMQEALMSSDKELKITYSDNIIAIVPDKGFNEVQQIFPIFAEVLKRSEIDMTYDKSSIQLRFTDESIDS